MGGGITSQGSTTLAKATAPVRTRQFVLAQTMANAALEHHTIAGIFGEPGTGKTTAVKAFCASSTVPSIYISASPSPQRKEIYEEILLAVSGHFDHKATARELRRQCEDVLSDSEWIVVIDESQHLKNMWHQQLRSLHEGARFCLLLVGGTGAQATLRRDGQLWSRVAMRMHFDVLEGDELFEVLSQIDPIFGATERKLLVEIDRRDCGGNLRNWSHFLSLARPMLPKTPNPDRLSDKVVRAVFALRGIT